MEMPVKIKHKRKKCKALPVCLGESDPLGYHYTFETVGDTRKRWDVTRLIELSKDLPVQRMPLSGMLLDQCVEELPLPAFARKMRRVMEADLYYPIILGKNGCIFDGHHRVMKALYLGKTYIRFVRFDEDPPTSN
jgi:hypothetical protein